LTDKNTPQLLPRRLIWYLSIFFIFYRE